MEEGKKKKTSRKKKSSEAAEETKTTKETEIKEERRTQEPTSLSTAKMEESGRSEIKSSFYESTVVKDEQTETASPGFTSLISQKIKDVTNKVNAQITMAKNMYMLFQGMKQSYGGDTKKALSVLFGFAKEEGKRRIDNLKSKIKKKIFGELD
ncbi:MAG: hypothetical protein NZ927_01360 [Candidatus Calescibacterium sp.]|nr:hypothetical protein [Candidatus Calescibacterium sp.]MDW8087173.1 hypothetical protein [Candidatus Calescibacterium sp.]